MADDTNEDSWLYGTSNPDSTTNEEDKVFEGETQLTSKTEAENEAEALDAITNPIGEYDSKPIEHVADDYNIENDGDFEEATNEEDESEEVKKTVENKIETEVTSISKVTGVSDEDDDDEDDSDDDINVVIGDIKTAPSYNLKQRSNLLAGNNVGSTEKSKITQSGKFSMEDFEGVGTINGIPAHEFSIDSLEEKPWRKPGADITDYFNYGFNEETWRAYCERQKRMRVVESGVGLASLTQNQSIERQHDNPSGVSVVVSGTNGNGPNGENLQVIGQSGSYSVAGVSRINVMNRGPRPISTIGSKEENTIQVMTAQIREYQRPGSLGHITSNFHEEPFFPEPDNFDYGYEPTQESQWNNENAGWTPSGVKELTAGPSIIASQSQIVGPPPSMSGPPPQLGGPPPQMGGPLPQLSGPPPQMVVPPPTMGVPPSQIGPHSSNNIHGNPPPLLGGMRMPANIGMAPPPGMSMIGPGPMSGPGMRIAPLMGPPRMMGQGLPGPSIDRSEEDRERERRRRWERERDRERDRRRSKSREKERDRRDDRDREYERLDHRSRERDRDKERDREEKRDREKDKERDRIEENERNDEDRDRRKRERERDRDKERSRRDRSRSRERNKRRSKSRDKERDRNGKSSSTSRSEKKKSHRKEKEKEDE